MSEDVVRDSNDLILLEGMGLKMAKAPEGSEKKGWHKNKISEFAQRINQQNLISTIASGFDIEIPNSLKDRLILSGPLDTSRGGQRRSPATGEKAWSWIDGAVGMMLGYKDDKGNITWLSTISFDIPGAESRQEKYRENKKLLNGCPVIVQLQTPQYGKTTIEKNSENAAEAEQKANEIRKQFRWEKLLIALVIEYAHDNKIPIVYLEPAEKNQYVLDPDHNLPLDRLKLRYDKTAERLRFILGKKSELWEMHIIDNEDKGKILL